MYLNGSSGETNTLTDGNEHCKTIDSIKYNERAVGTTKEELKKAELWTSKPIRPSVADETKLILTLIYFAWLQ